MRLFYLSILFAIGLNALAQKQISGTITGLEFENVYLMRIQGDNRKILDTAQTDQTGSFTMVLDRQFPTGLYALVSGPGNMVELIYNNEDIRFVTTGNTEDDQVQIIESVENLIYYDYLAVKGMNLYKIDLLRPVVQNYPSNDPFYGITLNQLKMLQNELTDRTETLAKENPKTIASHFIKVDTPVFPDPGLSPEKQKAWLKVHYFDEVDFTDTVLIRSNILTSKIVNYLGLYQRQGMTQEELEEQLLVAVDTVLSKAFVNQQMYEYIMDFLVGGFEAIGFESGLEHLANQNQLDELCVNTERKSELENKLELIKKLAIGKSAPDFETTDLKGNKVKLSDIKSKKTLLIFWASWCPHCEEIMPKIKQYYDPDNTGELQIVAISIDEDKNDLEQAIAQNNYQWINIGELKGWNGKIVNEYGIVATPSFFLLDADKKIIAKPANDKEMELNLGQLK